MPNVDRVAKLVTLYGDGPDESNCRSYFVASLPKFEPSMEGYRMYLDWLSSEIRECEYGNEA